MNPLSETLNKFIDNLNRKQPIFLTPDGFWAPLPNYYQLKNFIFPLKKKAEQKLIHHFCVCLNRLEMIPIHFDLESGDVTQQKTDFKLYLNAAECLEKNGMTSTYLKRGILALRYRLESMNGGIDPSFSGVLLELLKKTASEWKLKQIVFWDKKLNEGDHLRLEKTCFYPQFVKFLLQFPDTQEEFFTWIFRDGMFPEVFIEYPHLYQKIMQANLSGRIGRLGGNYLKIQKIPLKTNENLLQKIVTLPFEGVDTNVLNPQHLVTFSGNYKLTIQKIFEVFRDKDIDDGNLEFMALGIMNWNTHCWGWWNEDAKEYRIINLSEEDWWNELPVLEILSKDEAQRRYKVELDGQKWLLMAKASREYINLSFLKSHAYLEIVIPTGGQGYSVYDFGKVAMKLPRNSLETLSIFGRSIEATIGYPDDNIYYTHRQHAGYSFELSPQEGVKFMESIRNDMLKVREGHIVYQIETENCGRWIQDHLEDNLGEKRVPNLFKVSVLESTPHGLLGAIFNFARKLPARFQSRVVILPQFFTGAWSGKWVVEKKGGHKVWKSLTTSSFWRDGVVHLPAFMHKQIDNDSNDYHKISPTPHIVEGLIEKSKLRNNLNDPFNLLDVFEDDKTKKGWW